MCAKTNERKVWSDKLKKVITSGGDKGKVSELRDNVRTAWSGCHVSAYEYRFVGSR